MLHQFDQLILDKFERFSHWTQRMAGIKSNLWAILNLLVSMAFALRDMAAPGHDLAYRTLGWLGIFCAMWILHRMKNKPERPEFMNEQKALWWFRVAYLSLVLVGVANHWQRKDFSSEFLLIAFYFEACDDLPPSKSRLRQWVEGFRAVPEVVREGA